MTLGDIESKVLNPFNPVTEIRYALPDGNNVLLKGCDVSGRQATTFVDAFQDAGYRCVTWNGTGSRGLTVSSGVCFYQIISRGCSEQMKMSLLWLLAPCNDVA